MIVSVRGPRSNTPSCTLPAYRLCSPTVPNPAGDCSLEVTGVVPVTSIAGNGEVAGKGNRGPLVLTGLSYGGAGAKSSYLGGSTGGILCSPTSASRCCVRVGLRVPSWMTWETEGTLLSSADAVVETERRDAARSWWGVVCPPIE